MRRNQLVPAPVTLWQYLEAAYAKGCEITLTADTVTIKHPDDGMTISFAPDVEFVPATTRKRS